MRITEVKVIVTSPQGEMPYYKGVPYRGNYVFVKIVTDNGLYGIGEASLGGRTLIVAETIRKRLAPKLLGADPDRIEDVWQAIFRGVYWRDGPILMSALGGIDMALWDLKGKHLGVPVYSLLGGKTREKLRVYLTSYGTTFEEVLESCQRLMREGCTAIKVGVYYVRFKEIQKYSKYIWEPEPYLRVMPRLFKYLRENIGEEIDLIHDVHERINPIQACRLAKELEPYRLFFLEDPIRPEHKESLRLLRSHTSIPIAVGEHYFTVWDCLPLITEQLVDFLRVDPVHYGGITPTKKLSAIAEPYYIDMAFHGPPDISPVAYAASAHVNLSIPNFGIQEWFPSWPELDEIVKGGPKYEDGYLIVPEEPGLGVDIDEEAAKEHPYEERREAIPARDVLPVLRRLDGSVTDW